MNFGTVRILCPSAVSAGRMPTTRLTSETVFMHQTSADKRYTRQALTLITIRNKHHDPDDCSNGSASCHSSRGNSERTEQPASRLATVRFVPAAFSAATAEPKQEQAAVGVLDPSTDRRGKPAEQNGSDQPRQHPSGCLIEPLRRGKRELPEQVTGQTKFGKTSERKARSSRKRASPFGSVYGFERHLADTDGQIGARLTFQAERIQRD